MIFELGDRVRVIQKGDKVVVVGYTENHYDQPIGHILNGLRYRGWLGIIVEPNAFPGYHRVALYRKEAMEYPYDYVWWEGDLGRYPESIEEIIADLESEEGI